MGDIFNTEGEEFQVENMAARVNEQLGGIGEEAPAEPEAQDDVELPTNEEIGQEAPAEDEAPAEEVTEEPAEDTGQAEEPPAEEAEEPEPIEIPDKFKNEDGTINQDALMKSYVHLETKLGEKPQIDPSLDARMRELEQQNQTLIAAQQASANTDEAATLEGRILNHIENDSGEAYRLALDGFRAGTLSKNHVESVIDYVYEAEDASKARRMDRQLRDELVKQQVTPVTQTQEAGQAQARLQQTIAEQSVALTKHIGEENAEAYAKDIGDVLRARPHLLGDMSPQAVLTGMNDAYEIAKGMDSSKTTAAKKAQQDTVKNAQTAEKKNAQVLSTGADTPDTKEQKTAEEEYHDKVFDNRNERQARLDILFGN